MCRSLEVYRALRNSPLNVRRAALWLPRPLDVGIRTESRLSEWGISCYVEPLTALQARPLPRHALLPGYARQFSWITATSAAAFSAMPALWREGRFLVAGEQTMAAARAFGARHVILGGQVAADLLQFLAERAETIGTILQTGTSRPRLALAEELCRLGVRASFLPVYDVVTKPIFSRAGSFLWRKGLIGAVALYSHDGALAWRQAVLQSRLTKLCQETVHICISERTALPIVDLTENSFILISQTPTRAGIERLIRQFYET